MVLVMTQSGLLGLWSIDHGRWLNGFKHCMAARPANTSLSFSPV